MSYLVPWKLRCDFNTLPSLFHDHDLPYDVVGFCCSCGKNSLIIEHLSQEKNEEEYHECAQCSNGAYYEGNSYIGEAIWYYPIQKLFSNEVLQSLLLHIAYDETTHDIICSISIDLPFTIDLVCEKMLFRKKRLFELRINQQGEIHQQVYVNFDLEAYIRQQKTFYALTYTQDELIGQCKLLVFYKAKMLRFLQTETTFASLRFASSCQSLKEIAFFLKYPHFGDYDFIRWLEAELLPATATSSLIDALDFVMNGRKEKSFRKAVFTYYETKKRLNKPFSFLMLQAVAKHIKDVNIALELFRLSFEDFRGKNFDYFQEYHFEVVQLQALIETFFSFLTQRYSDRQIAILFEQYKKNEIFWLMDTMMMIHHMAAYLEYFPITPCHYVKLHEAVNHYHPKMMYQNLLNMTFSYDEQALKACINTPTLCVKMPMTGIELYQWGEDLHNCLAGYDAYILSKTSLIYGFYDQEELLFAVEIRQKKIVQAKAKYNQDLRPKDMDFVTQWYENYIVRKKEM